MNRSASISFLGESSALHHRNWTNMQLRSKSIDTLHIYTFNYIVNAWPVESPALIGDLCNPRLITLD